MCNIFQIRLCLSLLVASGLTISNTHAQCNVAGGVLSTPQSTTGICKGDAVPDYIQFSVTGNNGLGVFGIINQNTLDVVASNTTGFFNMENYPAGQYLVGHVSVNNASQLNGITNLTQLSGCYSISNSIAVSSFPLSGGILVSNSPVEVCGGEVSVSVSGSAGPIKRFALLTEFQNQILQTNNTGVFDLTNLANGIYRVVHVAYIGDVNLASLYPPFLPPCMSPSNVLTFTKVSCN